MPTRFTKTVLPRVSIVTLVTLLAACVNDPAAPPAQVSGVLTPRNIGNTSKGELIVPLGDPLATFGSVVVAYGGYGSALAVDAKDPALFYSMTDRGPNVGRTCNGQSVLAFPVPGFTPQIGKFRLSGSTFTRVGTILLRQANGTRLNGFPHPNAQANRTEVPDRRRQLGGTQLSSRAHRCHRHTHGRTAPVSLHSGHDKHNQQRDRRADSDKVPRARA